MTSFKNIQLVRSSNIRQGGFSDIFHIETENIVYKLFINQNHPNVDLDPDRVNIEDKLRRLVFESEKNAYEIAKASQELSQYTPKYFGSGIIGNVKDLNGNDISNWYLLDCCYKIEFLHGLTEDLNLSLPHIQKIISLFQSNGIAYLEDSAAFYQSDESKTKFIDFATEHAYYKNELKWLTCGKL